MCIIVEHTVYFFKRALYRASQFHLGRPIPSIVNVNETVDLMGSNARGLRSKLLALRTYMANEFQITKKLHTKVSMDC